MMFILGSLESV